MKPHLDIEYGDLVSVVRGLHKDRVGIVIDISYRRGWHDSLMYTVLDEATQETITAKGINLKILTADYLSQHQL